MTTSLSFDPVACLGNARLCVPDNTGEAGAHFKISILLLSVMVRRPVVRPGLSSYFLLRRVQCVAGVNGAA